MSAAIGSDDAVSNDCIARNHCTLIGSGVSPVQLVYGSCDFPSAIEHINLLDGRDLNDMELARHRHLIGMLRGREDTTHADAEITISICLQRNIRIGTRYMSRIGDHICGSFNGR